MKKVMVMLAAGLLGLIMNVTQVHAGNGDLVVNGNLAVGTTTPLTTIYSVGKASASDWAGDATNYYGGGSSFGGLYGNSYGAGAAYTYWVPNSHLNSFQGGNSGGYFKGGNGYAWAGGGAGIVAIGGDITNTQTSDSTLSGGAGIYAQGGVNALSGVKSFAGYFNGTTVVMNGNVGVGTKSPAYPLQVIGTFAATTKNFDIPDPRFNDEQHRLIHSTLEGPEVGVYYRGTTQLVNGVATVALPGYFEALTRSENRTVLLTAKYEGVGQQLCSVAASDVVQGSFSIQAYGVSDSTMCNHKVYWEVNAERSDVAKHVSEVFRKKLTISPMSVQPVGQVSNAQ